MIEIKKGYIAYNILYVLSMVNCFPVYSLYVLGNKRIYNSTVKEMLEKQTYYNCETKEKVDCKALITTGKGREKIVKLSAKAKPLLEWIGTDQFFDISKCKTGNKDTLDRLCRKAETFGFFYRSGLYNQDAYLNTKAENSSDELLYYSAKKMLSEKIDYTTTFDLGEENKKTSFTRVVGVLMNKDTFLPVYNVRDKAMRWVGNSEQKAKASLFIKAKEITNTDNINTILLLGKKYEVGMTTVLKGVTNANTSYGFPVKSFNLSGVYSKIHFLPFGDFGNKLLRFLLTKNGTEIILDRMFNCDVRNDKSTYDLVLPSGEFVYSFCDSDLARFSKILKMKPEYVGRMNIVCFEDQVEFVQSQFEPGEAIIKSLDIDEVLHYFDVKGV